MLLRITLLSALATSISEAASATWPIQTYKTETFTPPNLSITKTGVTQSGYLFFPPSGAGTASEGPLIMTDTNDLVWYGGVVGQVGPQDFRVQQLNGQDVLVYFAGQATLISGGYGAVVILDNTYTELYRLCPDIVVYFANFKRRACPLDVHEYFITPQGTIMVTAYNMTAADLSSIGGPTNGYVFDGIFMELDIATQEVLFRWSALEHPDLFPFNQSTYPLGSFGTAAEPWDFFHINTVHPCDNGWIVNSRFYSTIFRVNSDGTVQWRLEGTHGRDFTLDPEIFFSYEHHAYFQANNSGVLTITMFNNDNDRPPAKVNGSSGLELMVDENAMTVSLSRKLVDPTNVIYSQAQGSYQNLDNGSVYLGYGSNPIAKEFDALGNVAMKVQFGGSSTTGYRSYRLPWTATPYYPPKTVANSNRSNGTTVVYMSWNGATEVASWNVMIGPKRTALRKVKTVSKSGFETMTTIAFLPNFLMVQAVAANGTVMRNSAIIKPVNETVTPSAAIVVLGHNDGGPAPVTPP